jgi:bifunctional UDP-N-acetylglucosamine pyrophosphorylase/glucosamine-1-phosphate N-acetyltransferase
VGLKQTIFLPFVTAGSLINFCDCLMAGGTSRKNHSEVGSSYIHFNFTPRQDKATASLIGDVPRGVMLDRPPIFLGGQGGLVGPARIAYGTIIAAGAICRQDILAENQLVVPSPPAGSGAQNFIQAQYRSIHRIVVNNLIYIGNLHALKAWYRFARKKYMTGNIYSEACWTGAISQIEAGIRERLKRMKELAGKMPSSLELAGSDESFPQDFRLQQEALAKKWPEMEQQLEQPPSESIGERERHEFLSEWDAMDPQISCLDAVARLSSRARAAGTAWLQAIVDSAASRWSYK